MPAPSTGPPDRYEPLPGLLSLPAFLVRKLGRRGRVAVLVLGCVVFAGAVVATILLVPEISENKRADEAAERREAAAARERLRRRLIAEQRPSHGSGPPAPDRAGREALVARVEAGITRDVRARVRARDLRPPPAQYTTCEPLHGEPGAGPVTRLSCVAVTSEIPAQGESGAGVLGHPFRARVDYGTGRYAWCKVSGRAGEGSFTRLLGVRVPRACGG